MKTVILALLLCGKLAAQEIGFGGQTVITHGGCYEDQTFFNPVISQHAIVIKTDEPIVFKHCTITGSGPGVSAIYCERKADVSFIDCTGLGNGNSAFLELTAFRRVNIEGGQLIGWSQIIQVKP